MLCKSKSSLTSVRVSVTVTLILSEKGTSSNLCDTSIHGAAFQLGSQRF